MDGYTFPIRRLHLIRRTGKDAKGLVAKTVQESRFSHAEKTYREALCITVVRESRSAEFARLVPPEKQIPFCPNEQWYFRSATCERRWP
jgi:hypothetical protein